MALLEFTNTRTPQYECWSTYDGAAVANQVALRTAQEPGHLYLQPQEHAQESRHGASVEVLHGPLQRLASSSDYAVDRTTGIL